MPSFDFVTVDVFTDQRFGGNPLAVFTDAAGLDEALMQPIAREFNLSETVFVLPPADPAHHARLRIFNPVSELPFAGHPNVGTGFVLAGLGTLAGRPPPDDTLLFEEEAGLVAVRILRNASGAPSGAEVAAPQTLTVGAEIDPELVADCIGLSVDDIWQDTHPPVLAGVGLPFVMVELTTREALAHARPVASAFADAAAGFPETGQHFAVHAYMREDADPMRLHARMFAPLMGVPEDPATGSANAALAALIASLAPGEDVTLGFDITQGEDMGRLSRLIATGRKSAEEGVRGLVAGGCVPVFSGTFTV